MANLKSTQQVALLQAIEAAQVSRAEEILTAALDGTSGREVLVELLEPVLVAVGEAWMAKAAALAQGYLAAKLAERVLDRVLEEEKGAPRAPNPFGPVVLGNIEDDFHALGRRMVAMFLGAAGWEVIDLGNDVPPEGFVSRAREAGARVIGASAMMYTTARNIRRLREALDREGLSGHIQLAVGGAVFNLRPELAGEVGGDGSARTALETPALFERLARRSLALGGSP